MEGFFELFFFFGIMFGIGYGIYGIVQYLQAKKALREEKEKAQFMEQFDNMMATMANLQIQRCIEDLNFDYALGLYDGDIYAIAQADDPFTELSKYIDPMPSTLEVFKEQTISKVDIFLGSSTLSNDEQREIKEKILKELSMLDEELVSELVDVYSQAVVDKVYFLRGKINYTLATLGALQGIADDTNNSKLSEHIYQIRKKRGFVE